MNAPQLSKYEIACITAGVPATGDPLLDQIITTGLRFKTAAEILGHIIQIPGTTTSNEDVKSAMELSTMLIKEFSARAGGDNGTP